jgi:2-polyprenyl-6-methoxyphenol hydroxylase-like FAD-dependent oxidoreductase
VAIIGAGAGGQASASQLAKTGKFDKKDIVLFDPSENHYYQPAFTMVGGGVIGNA